MRIPGHTRADDQYGPGVYRLSIDLVGRGLVDLKPLITHTYVVIVNPSTDADSLDTHLRNVGRRLTPPRTARAWMVNSPSRSLVSHFTHQPQRAIALNIQSRGRYRHSSISHALYSGVQGDAIVFTRTARMKCRSVTNCETTDFTSSSQQHPIC